MVLVGFKPDLWRPTDILQCFDTVGFVIWPVKIVPEMTYYVSSGTLNSTHSLKHSVSTKSKMMRLAVSALIRRCSVVKLCVICLVVRELHFPYVTLNCVNYADNVRPRKRWCLPWKFCPLIFDAFSCPVSCHVLLSSCDRSPASTCTVTGVDTQLKQ